MRRLGARLTAGRLAGALGLLLLVAVAVGPGRVAAHAVLLRTTPSASQTLAVAPTQVQLLFSEPIDPVFSRVSVFSATGQSVDAGDAHVDPNDDHLLVVSLKPGLPNAVYTVAWRSLSTIDVHPDEGKYQLFVGMPVAAGTRLATGTSQVTATPETTLGRWWFYLAATLFAGVLAVWKFVLGTVLEEPRHAAVRVAVRRQAYRLVVLGGVLLVVGTLYTAVAQAAAAADVSLGDALGQPLADLLLRGRFATIWWPRIGLEVASLLLIGVGGLEGLASECVLATLPAVLLTSSLTSHGAALPTIGAAGIAVDWLHIVGGTAWVGGLTGVLVSLPLLWRPDASNAKPLSPSEAPALSSEAPALSSEAPALSRVLARFARFAVVAAALVVLSGVLQTALEVGAWADLLVTAYGQLLLVKVVLVAAMLLLAAFNEWRGRASTALTLDGTAAPGLRGLRRGVRAELALGIVVLGVAAVLSGTPPAPAQAPGQGPLPIGSRATNR